MINIYDLGTAIALELRHCLPAVYGYYCALHGAHHKGASLLEAIITNVV